MEFFSEEHADYMSYFTNYLAKRDLYKIAKTTGLRCSFRYTEWFYINKLRSMIGLAIQHKVEVRRTGFWHAVLLHLFMRLSSVTVFLEKEQIYRR